GLLAPKPLGVFRYRLLRSVPDNRLHFYLELALIVHKQAFILHTESHTKAWHIYINNIYNETKNT
ncbi:MAG: hypothetical protein KIC78_12515, partial [Prevotella sp.]|uniref:hypothetical protein n=1 Tax=Prevotella sp. TaxID=59823 RepID=UPI00257EEF03